MLGARRSEGLCNLSIGLVRNCFFNIENKNRLEGETVELLFLELCKYVLGKDR